MANDRSLEAEARAILGAAVAAKGFGAAWLELAATYRGDEIPLPPRSQLHEVDHG